MVAASHHVAGLGLRGDQRKREEGCLCRPWGALSSRLGAPEGREEGTTTFASRPQPSWNLISESYRSKSPEKKIGFLSNCCAPGRVHHSLSSIQNPPPAFHMTLRCPIRCFLDRTHSNTVRRLSSQTLATLMLWARNH